jgi:hypothetical protein
MYLAAEICDWQHHKEFLLLALPLLQIKFSQAWDDFWTAANQWLQRSGWSLNDQWLNLFCETGDWSAPKVSHHVCNQSVVMSLVFLTHFSSVLEMLKLLQCLCSVVISARRNGSPEITLRRLRKREKVEFRWRVGWPSQSGECFHVSGVLLFSPLTVITVDYPS